MRGRQFGCSSATFTLQKQYFLTRLSATFISYSAENPCQQDQHGCDHICYQSDGEDKCSCRVGYELNGDGKTCAGIYKQFHRKFVPSDRPTDQPAS